MNINDVKNNDLVYFGERIEPYFASSIIIRGMLDQKNLSKVFKWKKGSRWMYTNDYFFNLKDDLLQVQAESKKMFREKGSEYANALIKKCMEYANRLIETSKKIQKEAERKDLSKKKMHGLLRKYMIASSNYMVFQNIALFEGPVAELTDDLTNKYSTNKNKSESFELAGLMTTASKLTAAEKETDEFLQICARKDRDKSADRQPIDRHLKKYGWLSLRFFVGEPWTRENLIKRSKGFDPKKAEAELFKRQEHRKAVEKKISDATKSFSKKDKELVKLIRDIVYLRTQRTDFFQESSYYVQPLVKKIAAELKVSYPDLLYLSCQEVLLSLEGKFDYPSAIKRRKKGFLIFFDFDKDIILESDDALRYVRDRPILDRTAKHTEEISGKTAYPGYAKGRVKIVKTDKDNAKFLKGDILVSIMTTPNLTPSMEKAAAIITDEGGITCHAAIFAREMKKPCIIGTHVATKVLKDGDMVEVDGGKGVVKLIKRGR